MEEKKDSIKISDLLESEHNGEVNNIDEGVKKVHRSKKKKKNIALISFILIVGVLAVISVKIYQYFTSNPTEIIKTVINNYYEDFSKSLNDISFSSDKMDIFNEGMSYSGSIRFKDGNHRDLEKEKICYDILFDYKNKRFDGTLKMASRENENIADARFLLKNDKMYMKSNSLFSKTYEIGDYKFDENFNFEDLESIIESYDGDMIEDIDYIVREFKNALIESLDEKKLTLSREDVEVLGKTKKTDKITYTLDREALDNFRKKFSENVLKNDDLIEKLATISSSTEEEIRDYFESEKDEDDFDGVEDGELNIYTTGLDHEVVKVELKDSEATLEMLLSNDDVLISMESASVNVEIKGLKRDDGYEITGELNGVRLVKFLIKENDKKAFKVDYEITYMGLINLSGNLDVTQNNKEEKESSTVIDFSANGKVGEENLDFGLEFVLDVKGNVDVPNIDVTEALKIDAMTEEDANTLMTKITELENSAIFKYLFGSTIEGELPSFESSL